MLTSFFTWWHNVPATIRDFTEGLIAGGIWGAADQLYTLTQPGAALPTFSDATHIVIWAFIGAVIAKARHGLARPEN